MGRADGPRSWEVWSTNVLIKQEKSNSTTGVMGLGWRISGPGGEATRAPGDLGQMDGTCMRRVGCCALLHPSVSRLGGARLGSHDGRQPIRQGGSCQAITLDYWTESEGNQSASIRRAAAPASRLLASGAARSGLGGMAGCGLQRMAGCHHFLPG